MLFRSQMEAHHIDPATGEDDASGGLLTLAAAPATATERDPNDPSTWGRVGRNEPCPCGSGKKYKHCHGAFVAE